MIIRIFDGAKGTGKSHLITRYAEKYPDAKIVHLTQYTDNSIEHLNELADDAEIEYILDRSYIGEFVYPYIYHRMADYTLDKLLERANTGLRNTPITVLVFDSDKDSDDIFERINVRDNVILTDEQKLQVVQSNQLFKDYSCLLAVNNFKVDVQAFNNYDIDGLKPLDIVDRNIALNK